MGDDRVFKYAEPPLDLQDKGAWEPLQYWVEKLKDGLLMVCCDVCNAVYWGRWEVMECKDGPARVVPLLEGGLLIRKGHYPVSCQCAAGRRWRKLYQVATDGLMASMRVGNQNTSAEARAPYVESASPQAQADQIGALLAKAGNAPNVQKALLYLVERNSPAIQALEREQTELQRAVLAQEMTIPDALARWHRVIAEMLQAARNLWRSEQVPGNMPTGT